MDSFTVCKACGGPINLAIRRKFEKIEGTELTVLTMTFDGPMDSNVMGSAIPPRGLAGYQLAYDWTTEKKNGQDIPALKLYMQKVEGAPAAKGTATLKQKSKEELVEMAVQAGISIADMTWSKDKLIAEIEKLVAAK